MNIQRIEKLAAKFEKVAQEAWWKPLTLNEFVSRIQPLDAPNLDQTYSEIKKLRDSMLGSMGPLRATSDPKYKLLQEKLTAINTEKTKRDQGAAREGDWKYELDMKVFNSPQYQEMIRKADAAVANMEKGSVKVNLSITTNKIATITSNNNAVTKIMAPIKGMVEAVMKKTKAKMAAPYNATIITLPI